MKKTAYEKNIEVIIKEAAKTAGFTAELTRQYVKLTGENVHRTAVDRWLHRNPAKRVVPNAITAEHLLQAVELTQKVFSA